MSLEISSRWVLVKIEAAVLMLSGIFFISCNGQYSGSCVIRNLVLCRVVLTMLPENGLLQICQGIYDTTLVRFDGDLHVNASNVINASSFGGILATRSTVTFNYVLC